MKQKILIFLSLNFFTFFSLAAAPGVIEKGDGINGRYSCFSNDGINCGAPQVQNSCASEPGDDLEPTPTPSISPGPSASPTTSPSSSPSSSPKSTATSG